MKKNLLLVVFLMTCLLGCAKLNELLNPEQQGISSIQLTGRLNYYSYINGVCRGITTVDIKIPTSNQYIKLEIQAEQYTGDILSGSSYTEKFLRQTSSGLYAYADEYCTSVIESIPFPLQVGIVVPQIISLTGSSGALTVVGFEDVTVHAGTFHCAKLVSADKTITVYLSSEAFYVKMTGKATTGDDVVIELNSKS